MLTWGVVRVKGKHYELCIHNLTNNHLWDVITTKECCSFNHKSSRYGYIKRYKGAHLEKELPIRIIL